jgi:hypothetical protein
MKSTTSSKKNPVLWKKIVEQVKRSNKGGNSGQWSARKAQLCVKLYKERGGKYAGKKSSSNSLHKWTVQKWRTKSGKPSLVTGERYLPEKAIKRLSTKEYRATSTLKRRSIKNGVQYSKQPRSIIKLLKRTRISHRR